MADPVYYKRHIDRDLNQVLSNAKVIVSELKNDGYRISESCRFSIFIKELSDLMKNGFGLEGHEFDITLLAEGIRDFAELSAIVKSKTIRQENRKDIQKLFGGSGKPSDDILTQSTLQTQPQRPEGIPGRSLFSLHASSGSTLLGACRRRR